MDWVETFDKSEWVARTLKLFLFAQKNFSIIHKWGKWPEIVHIPDNQFFIKASKLIEDDVDELGEFL